MHRSGDRRKNNSHAPNKRLYTSGGAGVLIENTLRLVRKCKTCLQVFIKYIYTYIKTPLR